MMKIVIVIKDDDKVAKANESGQAFIQDNTLKFCLYGAQKYRNPDY